MGLGLLVGHLGLLSFPFLLVLAGGLRLERKLEARGYKAGGSNVGRKLEACGYKETVRRRQRIGTGGEPAACGDEDVELDFRA